MLNKIFRLIGVAGVMGLVNVQAVLAQEAVSTGCELNGQPISCDELAAQAGGLFAGLGAIMIIVPIIALVGGIFWLMMLIHAASNPIENKALWIVILIFTGIIGAVVYYFVVKRNMSKGGQPLIPTAPAGK